MLNPLNKLVSGTGKMVCWKHVVLTLCLLNQCVSRAGPPKMESNKHYVLLRTTAQWLGPPASQMKRVGLPMIGKPPLHHKSNLPIIGRLLLWYRGGLPTMGKWGSLCPWLANSGLDLCNVRGHSPMAANNPISSEQLNYNGPLPWTIVESWFAGGLNACGQSWPLLVGTPRPWEFTYNLL